MKLTQLLNILENTPDVLYKLLNELPENLLLSNEGGDTWSPYDVVGHLVHGEKTDWITRLEKILSESGDNKFEPFDRFAQFRDNKGKSIFDLLDEFKKLRSSNLKILRSKNIKAEDYHRTGIHPDFGAVTLKNLLATWAVHDMDHLSQIARVIAYQFKEDVGPWKEYLRIVKPISK
jgi:hypothetical protein